LRYESAQAFRTALEHRLAAEAEGAEAVLMRLRKTVAFDRLLARLQRDRSDRWILKGGYALQLRLGDRARTTRDLDLHANTSLEGKPEDQGLILGDKLTDDSHRDPGDFFIFDIAPPRDLFDEEGPRAFRFAVTARLAGRRFESFHVDVGHGDPLVAPPVDLPPVSLLEFAGLPPARPRAVSSAQHFAEKIHALTLPRRGAPNTRTRDLVDLMLLLELGLPGAGELRAAIETIFQARRTHPVPRRIDDPPAAWTAEYAALAAAITLNPPTLPGAMARLRSIWESFRWPD
jgi:predicted nucleotidyltransferase component of viral defense system